MKLNNKTKYQKKKSNACYKKMKKIHTKGFEKASPLGTSSYPVG